MKLLIKKQTFKEDNMKLSTKKILIISMLLVCMTSLLFATGSGEDKDKPTITFVTPLIAHPVWLKAKEGFDQAGNDLGFNAQWIGPQGLDVNEMVKQIENAINLGSDGIITQGLVPEALEPVLKMAKNANIPVVLVDADVANVERLAFLGLSPDDFGRIGGSKIDEMLSGTKIVGAGIVPNVEHKIAGDIIQSYITRLSTHDAGFEHTTIVESKSDTFTAVTRFEELFNTYPDINVIYCTGAETAGAAAIVIKEKNLKGKVFVMGIDDIDETLAQIKEGYVTGTLAVNFYRYGYQSSQILMDYITDKKKPAEQNIAVSPILVIKNNIDTYGKDMKNVSSWK